MPVLVAAMGPQALRVTGELADGTLPYLAGPKTLRDHIVQETVAAEVQRYFDAGATEVVLTLTELNGPADRQRTWRLLGELARSRTPR